jgi:hypothetical protein
MQELLLAVFPIGHASKHIVHSMMLFEVGRLMSFFSSLLVSSGTSAERGFSVA